MRMKVVIDGQTYEVSIEDIHTRPVIAQVDGERYEVWPEDEKSDEQPPTSVPQIIVPEPVQTNSPLGGVAQAESVKEVKAPLPGVIVAILVNVGDVVTRSHELCTLEAMKMKNAIKSSRDGRIASIGITVGDQVSHGQVLMTFED
jgi:glutaconyl-CoA/methylmalonyl-CoA decarboxylase subunit gamma